MEWSSGPWQWHLTDGMGRAVNEKNILKWYKKRCDHHVTSAGQRKISKSPTGIELRPSAHWSECSNHWAMKASWKATPCTSQLHIWHATCILLGSAMPISIVCDNKLGLEKSHNNNLWIIQVMNIKPPIHIKHNICSEGWSTLAWGNKMSVFQPTYHEMLFTVLK